MSAYRETHRKRMTGDRGVRPFLTVSRENRLRWTAVVIPLIALGGCMSGKSPPVTNAALAGPAPAPPTIAAEQLVGNWGLAAYRDDKDIPRTQNEAKSACGNPYEIGRGSAGGLVMHLADQTEPTELALKGAAGGRNFIGPAAEPPGGPKDREITSAGEGVFTARWVDSAIATRYGTMIYVRCGAA